MRVLAGVRQVVRERVRGAGAQRERGAHEALADRTHGPVVVDDAAAVVVVVAARVAMLPRVRHVHFVEHVLELLGAVLELHFRRLLHIRRLRQTTEATHLRELHEIRECSSYQDTSTN